MIQKLQEQQSFADFQFCAFCRVFGTLKEKEEVVTTKKTCSVSYACLAREVVLKRTRDILEMKEDGLDHFHSLPTE
ncbi:hypothetical protein AAZX31_14G162700 [Glycine max]|uniref:Uncharacterized protein n=1 Tax=Glycine max TaxID=3847 RepID=K7M7P2_SOYBN|nr:hypothetical protein JHK86_040560 [Glycine max]KAH1095058.1 hypothetical protein GYH30_040380 [Glycine max]KRH16763.1 hypothetical protein GLYMA_14G176100v4 [Glycine max]